MTKPRFYPVNREGLVFWFDSRLTGNVAASGTVRDYSGKANHGTLNGDAYINNQGLQLDGVEDYVNIPNSSSFNFGSDPCTVLCRFKTDVTNTQQYIISKRDDSNLPIHPMWFIRVNSDNTIRSWVSSSATDYIYSDSSGLSYNDGNWHLVAMVYNGTNSIIQYIDGEIDGTQSSAGTVGNYDNTDDIFLGGSFDDGPSLVFPMNGAESTVIIFNRALAAQEIKRNYEALK